MVCDFYLIYAPPHPSLLQMKVKMQGFFASSPLCFGGGFLPFFNYYYFASGNASSGDVLENVDNTNKSAFIPIYMKQKV